jgi:hypothetical protein
VRAVGADRFVSELVDRVLRRKARKSSSLDPSSQVTT